MPWASYQLSTQAAVALDARRATSSSSIRWPAGTVSSTWAARGAPAFEPCAYEMLRGLADPGGPLAAVHATREPSPPSEVADSDCGD